MSQQYMHYVAKPHLFQTTWYQNKCLDWCAFIIINTIEISPDCQGVLTNRLGKPLIHLSLFEHYLKTSNYKRKGFCNRIFSRIYGLLYTVHVTKFWKITHMGARETIRILKFN